MCSTFSLAQARLPRCPMNGRRRRSCCVRRGTARCQSLNHALQTWKGEIEQWEGEQERDTFIWWTHEHKDKARIWFRTRQGWALPATGVLRLTHKDCGIHLSNYGSTLLCSADGQDLFSARGLQNRTGILFLTIQYTEQQLHSISVNTTCWQRYLKISGNLQMQYKYCYKATKFNIKTPNGNQRRDSSHLLVQNT